MNRLLHCALAAVALLLPGQAAAQDGAGWPSYGGGAGGGQYSPADQIDAANVGQLEQAWVYRTGDFSNGGDGNRATTFEANPILADGTLYICTPYNRVVALVPETGAELWSFEPDPPLARDYDQQHSLICRGVSYWAAADGGGGTCAQRIIAPVLDGRLLALDARSGAPCADFGDGGSLDINDAEIFGEGVLNITSPPVIFQDLAIVGTAIGDNQRTDMPDGVVRAYDVRTGALRWTWDPVPPDLVAQTGAANAWAPMSLDAGRGILYVPTSSPSPDYWGGFRPGEQLDAVNAVVALDAATGTRLWARQIIHHDLFDNDMPAQPALTEVYRDGRTVPALVQATKMGQLWLLDRLTGAPLFPVHERAVPQSDVPGESSAATQPVPVLPKPIADQGFTADQAWGITPLDREWCADTVRELRADGLYTPPSIRGSVQRPFFGGGSNWGGVAIDPVRRLVIGNVINLVQWVRLIPTADLDEKVAGPLGGGERARQKGAPYGMRRGVLMSPLGVPCNPPPWGTLTAIDLDTGERRWQVPFGRVPLVAGMLGPAEWGSPNLGGPLVTAGGLIFIGASMDARIRAINAWTGQTLWQHDLPFDGVATPMTFVSKTDGMQYVVLAAGGSSLLRKPLGDALVAFRLPASAAAGRQDE